MRLDRKCMKNKAEEKKIYLPDDLCESAMEESRRQWGAVAKPLNSLGRFEKIVTQMAGIYGTASVQIGHRMVVVMCADNGIVAEKVTQTDQSVTAVVARNIAGGRGNINHMAQQVQADVNAVDIGIASDPDADQCAGLINRKVAYGTADFALQPAMTSAQAEQAVQTGIELVKAYKEKGYTILVTGEMGIGNTTTGTAVAAALLGADSDQLTGRGAGLDRAGLARKKKVIREAIARYELQGADPMRILSCVGGYDICGMAGLFIGGARYHIPVVIDGCISATAALAAERLVPGCRNYMIASHCSREQTETQVLRELGLLAVLDADMALGEGTGAVMMLPLLDMALSVYYSSTTFAAAKIETYRPFED